MDKPVREGNKIDKPVWHVGDSWEVKCPLMVAGREKLRKVGECLVSVRVLEKTTFRGEDCYVLQIGTVDDARGDMNNVAYYTVDDRRLVRVEVRSADKDARLLNSENAPPGKRIYSVVAAMNTVIPLHLPMFPIWPGRSATPFHAEYKDEHTLSRVSKGEDVSTSMSVVEDTEAVSAEENAGVGSTALKVTFRKRVTRLVSGEWEEVIMEQVWIPGKPWWSSLRLSGPFGDGVVKEYSLADVPSGSE